MNKVFIGFDFPYFLEQEILQFAETGCLYIAPQSPHVPRKYRPQRLPLPTPDPQYLKARQLSDVLYANSPQGENTLTVRNGKRAVLKALYSPQHLINIPETDNEEAHAMFEDLMISPVL